MISRTLRVIMIAGFLVHAATASALTPGFDTLTRDAKAAMMRDPAQARRNAAAAVALAVAAPASPERDIAIATARWLSGEASLRMHDLDRAEAEVLAGLEIVRQRTPGSKLQGDLLLSLGGIRSARAAPDKALRDYLAAYAIYAKLKDTRQQAIALLDIGSIYQDAADYQRVLYYCSLALVIHADDPAIVLAISNNRANALVQLKRFGPAEQEYRRALTIATQLKNPLAEASIFTNIALAQVDANDLAGAKASAARGLRVARDGQADAARPLLLGAVAAIALSEERPGDAVDLVNQGFVADKGKTDIQVYRSMHDIAYRAYKSLGRSREALAELEILTQLEDEARSLAASTNSALLAARFDFANQNTRIATLKAGQLQRDIALTRLQARQTLILLVSVLLVVLAGLVFLIVNLRSVRRSRDAIAAVNAELTATNLHLEEALLAKSKFLATTSHEIRTPLNGILGMAQVLLAEPGLVAGVRERIELLQGAGMAMKALVDDILDFAALDAGRLDIQRSDADLPALLNDIVEFWRGPATRGGLTIALDCDPALGMVHEDVRRLRQVLFNLLSNAIKFTPAGRISVQARVDTGPAEQLVIAVEDSGVGIPEGELQKIFEEFHQVDTGRARQFSGSGLGLAISRALAAAMDGTIDVASREGSGSTFTLRLPLRRVAAEPAAPVDQGIVGRRTLKSATVVVVAGNPLAEATLRAVLGARVGAHVPAADCADAARRCAGGEVDLVLVEGAGLQAAGEAGIAALRALVEAAATATPGPIPVALLWKLSGVDPLDAIDRRLHVVAKPVGGDALVAALDEIIVATMEISTVSSSKDVWGDSETIVSARRRAVASA